MQRELQRGYKGTTKGHTMGMSPPGSKISENSIFQEFWDAMPRPGWSPWWVQRRPQTIPGPTFEPLTERPATAPPPPKSSKEFKEFQLSYGEKMGAQDGEKVKRGWGDHGEKMGRRWREDGQNMRRRWGEDGENIRRRWGEDEQKMRRGWGEDGEKMGRRWGEDGEKMGRT